jgi:hypothetical protein
MTLTHLPDAAPPPHSREAEQAVLGSLLLDRNAISSVKELVRPEDFYFNQHRLICETIIEMFEHGDAVDLVTVTDCLRNKKQIDAVGGAAYVTALLNSVPSTANVESYARIVKEKSVQRRAMSTFQLAAQKVGAGDGQGAAAEVRRTLEELESGAASPLGPVMLTPAAEVGIKKPEWLWEGRIPLGAVTALVGQPGLGKSTISLELAARASRGQLLGDFHGEPLAVVIATAEDSFSTTVLPRLVAAGADLARIHFVSVRRDGISGTIMLPDDIPAIRTKMREVGARLLIVDPLVAHLPGSVNSWRDQDVRRALAPLARLADDLSAAILVIVHLNKRDSADVLSRVSGSIGIVAAARSILLAAPDPSDSDGPTRVLAHVKSNLASPAPTLRYHIEDRSIDGPEGKIQTSGVVWMGEAPDVRASELLASQTPEERTEREEAVTWLQEVLADGPRPADELVREARRTGLSEKTLHRAKRDLGVRSVKTGFGKAGRWCWALPKDGQPGPKGGQYPEVDHLKQDASLTRASDAGPVKDGHTSNIDHLSNGGDHLSGETGPWGVPLEDGRHIAFMRMGHARAWVAVPDIGVGEGMQAWRQFALAHPAEEIGRVLMALERLDALGGPGDG